VQHDGTRERVSGLAHSVERTSRNLDGRMGDLKLRERAQRSATTASRRARGLTESRRRKPTDDPGRRARRLNTRGVQLRREQDYEGAADHHRAALTIARELGDRRAEALTRPTLLLGAGHAKAQPGNGAVSLLSVAGTPVKVANGPGSEGGTA